MSFISGSLPFLANPAYLRVWGTGATANTMRWLELLVGGIFVFQATQSPFLVAMVTVLRTLPLLFGATIMGVVSEAWDRKWIYFWSLVLLAVNASVLGALAIFGKLEVWHIAAGSIVGGFVWTNEMAIRRRMIGEASGPALLGQGVAFDSFTSSLTRCVGPVVGGSVYQATGIAGAFILSAVVHIVAALIISGLRLPQVRRPMNLGQLGRDMAEGFRIVRSSRILQAVAWVSIITNALGFTYAALIPPIGLHKFEVSPALVGVLAAAEPMGSVTTGLLIAFGVLRVNNPAATLVRGSLFFLLGVGAAALSPWYGLAVLLLYVGGLGTAAFTITQTTLVFTEAPVEGRSRVMGIIGACIGTWSIGVFLVGSVSEWIGPSSAMLAMALAGLLGLLWVQFGLVGGRHPAQPKVPL